MNDGQSELTRIHLHVDRIQRFFRKGCQALLWGNLCLSLCFFGGWGIVAYTPIGVYLAVWQSEATPFDELPDNVDAIVVLGGQSMRAADASKLYYAGKANRIIVSADVEALLDVLLGANIPRDRIELDVFPERTADHPRTILSLPGITKQSRLIIASDQMQERRAARLFRDAGYEHFWIYSQWHDIRIPQIRAKGYIGPVESVRVAWRYLAWLKYWFVDR